MKMSDRTRSRTTDWRTLVRLHDGARHDPYPVYQFSNNRNFKDRREPGRLQQRYRWW